MIRAEPIIQFRNIVKRFPGVLALDNVTLEIMKGTCHGLVGENGAGKSTLGKLLAGIYTPDEGEIVLSGKTVHINSPRQALNSGIGMVHQELSFCENMTVAENLCLGHIPSKMGFVNRAGMLEKAEGYLNNIGAEINLQKRVGELTVAQQQLIQIAAAVGRGARILIFDEPTSSLSDSEAHHLFLLIERLRSKGVTSIYISHRLPEVLQLCDIITVLRDGHAVITASPLKHSVPDGNEEVLDENSLIRHMIGRPLEAYFPTHLDHPPGEELLRVKNLQSPGKFQRISFSVFEGEIVGLAGLVGAGRTEILQAIFGLDPNATGEITIRGDTHWFSSACQAMAHRVGLIPEDRKRYGLILSMKARENISLPVLSCLSRFGWIGRNKERALAKKYYKKMQVRAPSVDTPTAGLSGGNQQKLVLAKWLAADSDILLIDEPTRGVDVGAKAEIHGLIDQLARENRAIVLISSDLPEIINLCTRILVMRNGQLVGEIPRQDASQDILMRMMSGYISEGQSR